MADTIFSTSFPSALLLGTVADRISCMLLYFLSAPILGPDGSLPSIIVLVVPSLTTPPQCQASFIKSVLLLLTLNCSFEDQLSIFLIEIEERLQTTV